MSLSSAHPLKFHPSSHHQWLVGELRMIPLSYYLRKGMVVGVHVPNQWLNEGRPRPGLPVLVSVVHRRFLGSTCWFIVEYEKNVILEKRILRKSFRVLCNVRGALYRLSRRVRKQ